MSHIPKDHIEKFFESNDNYRKYYIIKVHQYLLIDFTALSVILTLSFVNLTIFSRITTLILFFCAFSTKFIVITRKLKEYTIPFDEYWDKYHTIVKKAEKDYINQNEKNTFIERELDEVYYATLKTATGDTHKHYTEAMHKLNKYISFSFFNIIIVLLNIGFITFFSWNLICVIFVFPFDLIIFFIFIIAMVFGFDIVSYIKSFIKNSKGIFKNKIIRKDKKDGL